MKTKSISGALAAHARTITTTRYLIFRRDCLWTGFLVFATIAFGPRPAQAAVTEAWVQRYGSEAGSQDYASKVVTDAAGNVIVAGTTYHTQTSSGSDMLIIKYSGAGVPLWTNRYDGPNSGIDEARAVAVDASGNVFVTGYSAGTGGNPDYATIAYSGAGLPLWTNRYNGTGYGHDSATAVAVDGSGNVFVTGSSASLRFRGDDYATIAYSGAGVPLWTNRYNGPADSGDHPTAVAVDASGNVFVTGISDSVRPGLESSYDYATVAYSGAGVRLWTKRYNGPANSDDQAFAMAVDGSGNVFVTGTSVGSGGDSVCATIAYSGTGVPLWTNRYNGTGNSADAGTAVAVDASGNVFVAGNSATIAYSGAGVALWTNYYAGANAVAVNASGNVFVTGSSAGSGGDSDYATIAYSGAGLALWTNRYNGPANGYDQATAVAVDGSGNVFVTGSSYGSGSSSDYATVAYSGAGVALWTNRSDGGRGETSDLANAVAVDGSGNVFVTGSSASVGSAADYVTIGYSGAGIALWTNRYGGPGNYEDVARAMAVDGGGNVFVTGSSYGSGGDPDYATIGYSGAGVPLWTNRYGAYGYDDQASAVAVDGNGKVFVTGWSTDEQGSDYMTIGYSGAGVPLWTNRYDGPANSWDQANAVTVDASGNVFVTGTSYGSGGDSDYATIAYSGAGVPLWTNRYDGPANSWDQANAVAVDASGNVFVTGTSGQPLGAWDYATIGYSGAGVPLWTNRYNGPDNGSDQAIAVAVDSSGNVFVTGSSLGNESYYDYATIAYSGAGVALWTNRFNGPANGNDQATAVAVDGSGNVFVTGSSAGSGGYSDYATIVYSGAGVPLWTNRYNGPGNGNDSTQTKSSLAIGSDGAVYATGTSAGLFSSEFATVKYVWQTEIAIQLLSTIPPKVNLTLSGAPNSSWAIERAPEFTRPWTNLSTLLIGTDGSAQFQDTNAPHPAGFYRARQQ